MATMTVHYLAGEISAWLGDLDRLTTDPVDAARVAELRNHTERSAPHELVGLVSEVVDTIDSICWASLTVGNIAEFDRQTVMARDFAEFACAANLLRQDQV